MTDNFDLLTDEIKRLNKENIELRRQNNEWQYNIDKRIENHLKIVLDDKIKKLQELKDFFSGNNYLSKIDAIIKEERKNMMIEYDKLQKKLIDEVIKEFLMKLNNNYDFSKGFDNFIESKIRKKFSEFGNKEIHSFIQNIYDTKVNSLNAMYLKSIKDEMNNMSAAQRLILSKATRIVQENKIADFSNAILMLKEDEHKEEDKD